jgi:hypothetical protein
LASIAKAEWRHILAWVPRYFGGKRSMRFTSGGMGDGANASAVVTTCGDFTGEWIIRLSHGRAIWARMATLPAIGRIKLQTI